MDLVGEAEHGPVAADRFAGNGDPAPAVEADEPPIGVGATWPDSVLSELEAIGHLAPQEGAARAPRLVALDRLDAAGGLTGSCVRAARLVVLLPLASFEAGACSGRARARHRGVGVGGCRGAGGRGTAERALRPP